MANLNLEQILDLFQNGPRRYEEDPEFKAVIDSLKMGLGVYGVLDHVLKEKAEVTNIARNLRANYDAVIKSVGTLQKLNADKDEEIINLEHSLAEANEHLRIALDDVASYKEANDALADRCAQFDNYLNGNL